MKTYSMSTTTGRVEMNEISHNRETRNDWTRRSWRHGGRTYQFQLLSPSALNNAGESVCIVRGSLCDVFGECSIHIYYHAPSLLELEWRFSDGVTIERQFFRSQPGTGADR